MSKPLFPKSVRAHIRLEKARIRRTVKDEKEREELITKLYEGLASRRSRVAPRRRKRKIAETVKKVEEVKLAVTHKEKAKPAVVKKDTPPSSVLGGLGPASPKLQRGEGGKEKAKKSAKESTQKK